MRRPNYLKLSRSLVQCCVAFAVAQGVAVAAETLTIANYGGANGAAQQKAFVDPFSAANDVKITVVPYDGGQAQVKAMVEAHNVAWDLVEVESADVTRGCDQGLYEELDWSRITEKANLQPAAVTDCGAGFFVWATVLAYNKDAIKGATAPTSWADFWDLKKYPGKRGLRKTARGTLEFALLADGVKPKQVYDVLGTPQGVDRAFKKLDEIRSSIQWWQAGAQAPQQLVSGDVAMTSSFAGRVRTAIRDGNGNIGINWKNSLSDVEYWVIPSGAKKKELAEKYINFMLSKDPQKHFVTIYPNGPVNEKVFADLTPEQLSGMPNSPENLESAVVQSAKFWDEHGDGLDQKFAAWAAR